MSQALIPLFEEMGVEAVSVGVNTVTSPPAVPPIFQWKFQNSSVIGLWHPGIVRMYRTFHFEQNAVLFVDLSIYSLAVN